jgi:hypothetical protein
MALGLEFLGGHDGPWNQARSLDRWELYAQALLGTNEFTFVD